MESLYRDAGRGRTPVRRCSGHPVRRLGLMPGRSTWGRSLGPGASPTSSVIARVTDQESRRAVVVIARFDGDVEGSKWAYDDAHRLIMERDGPPSEFRHHCAVDESALYIISVWESEEHLRRRFGTKEFKETLSRTGFPPFDTAASRSYDYTRSSLRCHLLEAWDAGGPKRHRRQDASHSPRPRTWPCSCPRLPAV